MILSVTDGGREHKSDPPDAIRRFGQAWFRYGARRHGLISVDADNCGAGLLPAAAGAVPVARWHLLTAEPMTTNSAIAVSQIGITLRSPNIGSHLRAGAS